MLVPISCLIFSPLMILATKAPVALAQAKERKSHDNRNIMALFDLRIGVVRSAE